MSAKVLRFPSRGLPCEFRITFGADEVSLPSRHVVKIVWLHLPEGEDVDAAKHLSAGHLGVNGALDPADKPLIHANLRSNSGLRDTIQFPPLREFHRRPPEVCPQPRPTVPHAGVYDVPTYFVNGHGEREGAVYAAVAYIYVMHPGNRLRAVRKEAGMTQARLAELTGYSQDRISNYENGRRPMKLAEMRTFARALQCSPADLLNDDDNPERLNSVERQLLDAFRSSPEQAQQYLLTSALAVSDKKSTFRYDDRDVA